MAAGNQVWAAAGRQLRAEVCSPPLRQVLGVIRNRQRLRWLPPPAGRRDPAAPAASPASPVSLHKLVVLCHPVLPCPSTAPGQPSTSRFAQVPALAARKPGQADTNPVGLWRSGPRGGQQELWAAFPGQSCGGGLAAAAAEPCRSVTDARARWPSCPPTLPLTLACSGPAWCVTALHAHHPEQQRSRNNLLFATTAAGWQCHASSSEHLVPIVSNLLRPHFPNLHGWPGPADEVHRPHQPSAAPARRVSKRLHER